jgi:hypothetical protein
MLLKLPADTTKGVSGMTRWPGASKAATAAPGGGAAPAPRVRITAAQQRKLETLLFAKRLRADPDVRFADVNRVMRTSRVPLDPGYAIQRWHYEQIQLPGAWDVTTGGPIRVAVVDTGVASHPDLASKLELIDGRDFVSNPTNPDGDGRDANLLNRRVERGRERLHRRRVAQVRRRHRTGLLCGDNRAERDHKDGQA